jgi:hypothetical protein
MTPERFRRLRAGDQVQPVTGGEVYLVTAHYGTRVTAVRTIDLTNPQEWACLATAAPDPPGAAVAEAADVQDRLRLARVWLTEAQQCVRRLEAQLQEVGSALAGEEPQ